MKYGGLLLFRPWLFRVLLGMKDALNLDKMNLEGKSIDSIERQGVLLSLP